jgi:hypothetical protein
MCVIIFPTTCGQHTITTVTFKPSPPLSKVQPDVVSLIIAGAIKSVSEMAPHAPAVVKWLKVSLPLAHENKVGRWFILK